MYSTKFKHFDPGKSMICNSARSKIPWLGRRRDISRKLMEKLDRNIEMIGLTQVVIV